MIGWSTPNQTLQCIADEDERRHAERVMGEHAQLNDDEWFRKWGENLNERFAAWNVDMERMRAIAPPDPRHHRAGITTNHGHGQPKARRRMAKASRRRNRA